MSKSREGFERWIGGKAVFAMRTVEIWQAACAYQKEVDAEICESTKNRSGTNPDGQNWLLNATKYDCAYAIRSQEND